MGTDKGKTRSSSSERLARNSLIEGFIEAQEKKLVLRNRLDYGDFPGAPHLYFNVAASSGDTYLEKKVPGFWCEVYAKDVDDDSLAAKTYAHIAAVGVAELDLPLVGWKATEGDELLLCSDEDRLYGKIQLESGNLFLNINREPFDEISDPKKKATALKAIAGQLADFALYACKTYREVYNDAVRQERAAELEQDQKSLKFYGIEAKKTKELK
jgi:hypothetical protein